MRSMEHEASANPVRVVQRFLATNGYDSEVVERRIRRGAKADFIGCIDLLAWKDRKLFGVQVTTRHNVLARARKVEAAPRAPGFCGESRAIVIYGVHYPTSRTIVYRRVDGSLRRVLDTDGLALP